MSSNSGALAFQKLMCRGCAITARKEAAGWAERLRGSYWGRRASSNAEGHSGRLGAASPVWRETHWESEGCLRVHGPGRGAGCAPASFTSAET